MYRVFLGLGSNVGDRVKFLSMAVDELKKKIQIVSLSSIYETEPVGIKNQREFYNMVVEGRTELKPSELFQAVKVIEHHLGRKENTHLMPREIDIDILLYDGYVYHDIMLNVPHTEMKHRRFVLEPFDEIAPDVLHPGSKKTIKTLLAACNDRSKVVRTTHSLSTAHAI